MRAWIRRSALAGFFLPSLVLAQIPSVAGEAAPGPAVPVTVQAGAAFHVALEKKVRIKTAGVPVEGHIVEPIYVFDRMALPAATRVVGRVSSIEPLSRKRRALAIANGDFTPLRKAHVDFDTLVLKDGTRIPLHASISEGVPNVVHLTAGGTAKKKKGRVREAVDAAEQKAKDQVHQTVGQVTAPGKWERLKAAIAAELPYRRQWLAAGTQFTAEVREPLEVASSEPPPAAPDALAQLGHEIPPGSVVYASLMTPLGSATEHLGSPVRAVVSEPLFSADHHLILPAGAHLEGSVTKVVPARRLHRNGQLRFAFRQVELGRGATTRQVEASLQGVDAAAGANVKLDEEGGAHATTPKTNLIRPAIDVVLALGSLDGLDPHRKLDPDFHQGPDTAGGAVRGGSGFGLIGAVIGLAAHYRPISAGFAFYGAGWSVYTHLVARGSDVVFLKNTPMEIRFGTHEAPAPAPNKMLPSETATVGASF
jgi:hypothetical protein